MIRFGLSTLALVSVLCVGATVVPAAQNCTGANCGTKAKQEAAPGTAAKIAAKAQVAKKVTKKKKVQAAPYKAGKGRDGYSPEERAKILESARQVCRNTYGASSTVYRIDYKKYRVTCVPPGY